MNQTRARGEPNDRHVEKLARVNVIGTSGSGKSTFSRKLAKLLGSQYIEMDQLFWRPNWAQPSDEEFFARVRETLAQHESWVLDGNYSRSTPIKWQRVQTVIWLDYSFATTVWQAIQRAFLRALSKEELWPGTGNRESFRKSFFSRESIILWTISTHRKVRQKYHAQFEDPQFAHLQFVRLRNRREADAFLRDVEAAVVNSSR